MIVLYYFLYFASVGVNIASFFIVALFIVPLQVKEARVKNGLAMLRKQLLLYGITVSTLSLLNAIVLTTRFYVPESVRMAITISLIFIHSLGFAGLAVLGYKIYHQQYTDISKAIHAQIEKVEKKMDAKNKK